MQVDFCISSVTLIDSKWTKEFKYKSGIGANRSMQVITIDEKKIQGEWEGMYRRTLREQREGIKAAAKIQSQN